MLESSIKSIEASHITQNSYIYGRIYLTEYTVADIVIKISFIPDA